MAKEKSSPFDMIKASTTIAERKLDMHSILQQITKLSLNEKYQLISYTKGLVLQDLNRDGNALDLCGCPHCTSQDIIKKGHDKRGNQCYLCKNCRRTFSHATHKLLAHSKLDTEVWSEYLEGMLAGKSLRDIAKTTGVSLKTSWYMRIRVCEVMQKALLPFRSGSQITTQIIQFHCLLFQCTSR